ncbi:Rmf/CrpP fold protein [Nocardioides sp. KR10-350]|uniref:Rmf/CrpP fold protein n=1 Tax=Nocardioides cheoyonin TaxID=3156615 RepID=UPI0032B52F36
MVKVARGEPLGTVADGAHGARDGTRVTACPHDADGKPVERLRAAAWLRGYAGERRRARRAHLTVVR